MCIYTYFSDYLSPSKSQDVVILQVVTANIVGSLAASWQLTVATSACARENYCEWWCFAHYPASHVSFRANITVTFAFIHPKAHHAWMLCAKATTAQLATDYSPSEARPQAAAEAVAGWSSPSTVVLNP